MKKILIIDDEETIRTGLEYLIEWEEYGFEVGWTASNGLEGLDIILEKSPDLVITDIRMPGMTGLEMIREAKEKGCLFHSIILSGYSDFEYAKQAIQLGFVSYLLKPVDEEELIEILLKLNEEEKQAKSENFQHELSAKLFGQDHQGITEYSQLNICLIKNKISDRIREAIENSKFKCVYLQNMHFHYIVFLSHFTENEDFIKLFPKNQEVTSTGWVQGNQDLTLLIDGLHRLSKVHFFLPNQVISPRTLALLSEKVYTHNSKEKILNHVLMMSDNQKSLKEYQDNYLARLTSEEDCKWQVSHDFAFILSKVEETVREEYMEFKNSNTRFLASRTFPELMRIFEDAINNLTLLVARQLNNLDIITEILQYIETHYQEDLTLKSVSERFGYNSAYLGKKFKKKSNTTFLGYLEKIRMEKAAELLSNSNLMVYEISDRVGYKNVDYFYKKFKSFYQISPNEFRKKNEMFMLSSV
jgi:Response regulator containing CheY-like receiver domain and AraC-type DNA-binding domain